MSRPSSQPVAARFITTDSERSWKTVEFELEQPSVPPAMPGQGCDSRNMHVDVSKDAKNCTANLNVPERFVTVPGLFQCFFFLFKCNIS